MTRNKSEDFLRAMSPEAEPIETPATVQPVPKPAAKPKAAASAPASKPAPRSGLKHFGGYLDDETLEKIALLRVRLKKDNSELIKLAIDELHSKQKAKRAFGDA
jgi:hypothetical protein